MRFAKFFGIPLELVNPQLPNIVIALLSISFVCFFIINIVNFVSGLTWGMEDYSNRRFIIFSPFLMLLMGLMLIWKCNFQYWREWIPVLSIILVLLLVEFIFPLITQRKTKGYFNKLKAQESNDKEYYTLIDLTAKKYGTGIVVAFIFLWMSLVLADSSGKACALQQEKYYVVSTCPEMVVLRIYGDNFICSPLNRKNYTITQEFTVMKTPSKGEYVIKLEKVGPLTPTE